MNNEEKKLIENLFVRLHKTEIDFPNRDEIAEKLITTLLSKQPNSSYYMVQTILVQETVIKKLNLKISELEKNLSLKDEEIKNKSSSFLSNFFKSKKKEIDTSNRNNKCSHNERSSPEFHTHSCSDNGHLGSGSTTSIPGRVTGNYGSSSTNNSVSGFLSGALQTATGVAGGMVMANLLMNLFQNKKPEEEIINQISNNNDSISPIYFNSNDDGFNDFNVSNQENNNIDERVLHTNNDVIDNNSYVQQEGETISDTSQSIQNNNDDIMYSSSSSSYHLDTVDDNDNIIEDSISDDLDNENFV